MSFPQFYLHYDTKEDLVLGVDRNPIEGHLYAINIELPEELSKKLLNGEMSASEVIVNKYADPPYAIDKNLFPKDATFHLIFNTETLAAVKISAKRSDPAVLSKEKLDQIEVDSRIAYSILSGDSNLDDWDISSNTEGKTIVRFTPKSGQVSNLFKNRIDFTSLSEIDTSTYKAAEKNLPRLAEVEIDYAANVVLIKTPNMDPSFYADFFIAITNKNDPSYLIKMITMQPGKTIHLRFSRRHLKEMSFFSSRFHLRNTEIMVKNYFSGSIDMSFKGKKLIVLNDLKFSLDFPEAVIILRDKYDKTRVYRTIKLETQDKRVFNLGNIDPAQIEVEPINISKKFINVTRKK